MSADYQALLARVNELERLVVPQTMTNRQEKDWSPVGGPIRIVDRHGNTLPFQQTIQFLNADVAQVNDQDTGIQRTVVTPSGGGGGLSGEFSDDVTTTDSERLKFTAQSGPAVNHLELNTVSAGTFREADLIVAEDASNVLSAAGAAAITLAADEPSGTGILQETAVGTGSASASLSATDALLAPTTTGALQAACTGATLSSGRAGATNPAGDLTAFAGGTVDATGSSGPDALVEAVDVANVNSAQAKLRATQGTDTFQVRVGGVDAVAEDTAGGGRSVVLLNATGQSSFARGEIDTLSPPDGAVEVAVRGPYLFSLGSIASGATGTVNVPDVVRSGGGAHALAGSVDTPGFTFAAVLGAGDSVDVTVMNVSGAPGACGGTLIAMQLP